MIDARGNLWTYAPEGLSVDARVITTNGTVKKNGECVMGRGCAAEAKQRWPVLARSLGDHIRRIGNVPNIFTVPDGLAFRPLVSFPVKHHWMQQANPTLILVSARILSAIADVEGWQVIVMPRPGCGNGHLRWEDVRPLLEPILDNRFHVITF